VKWLLDELQHICDELKDENEIAIITKYGNIANRYTTIIMRKTRHLRLILVVNEIIYRHKNLINRFII